MTNKSIWGVLFIAMVIVSSVFLSCSKEDNSSTGKLKIQLTDAPFPSDLVAEANVTINKIEIRTKSEHKGSPYVTLSEDEMSFNLLDLTNGITASLINLDIEAGSYDLVRLYVSEANVVLANGTTYNLDVPSGAQSGLKIFFNPEITVAGGLTTELLLDFDVSKSFVVNGDASSLDGINGFNFKPVIKASNVSTAGRLVGNVTDSVSEPISGVQVSILAADTVYSTSFTDDEGDYAILGVDAGSYDVAFEKEGYQSDTISNVQIVAANATTQNDQLTEVDN